VALAVHLPGDGRVPAADLVVAAGAGGGAGVNGHVLPLVGRGLNDHAVDQVVVLVLRRLVVDDDKGLRLHVIVSSQTSANHAP